MTYNYLNYLKSGIESENVTSVLQEVKKYCLDLVRVRTVLISGMFKISTLKGKTYCYKINNLILKRELLSIYESAEVEYKKEFLTDNQSMVVELAFEEMLKKIENEYKSLIALHKKKRYYGAAKNERGFLLSAFSSVFDIKRTSDSGAPVYSFLIVLDNFLSPHFSYTTGKFQKRILEEFSSNYYSLSFHSIKVDNNIVLKKDVNKYRDFDYVSNYQSNSVKEYNIPKPILIYLEMLINTFNKSGPAMGFALNTLKNIEDCKKLKLFINQYLILGKIIGEFRIGLDEKYQTDILYKFAREIRRKYPKNIIRTRHPLLNFLKIKIENFSIDELDSIMSFIIKYLSYLEEWTFDKTNKDFKLLNEKLLKDQNFLKNYYEIFNFKWYVNSYNKINFNKLEKFISTRKHRRHLIDSTINPETDYVMYHLTNDLEFNRIKNDLSEITFSKKKIKNPLETLNSSRCVFSLDKNMTYDYFINCSKLIIAISLQLKKEEIYAKEVYLNVFKKTNLNKIVKNKKTYEEIYEAYLKQEKYNGELITIYANRVYFYQNQFFNN